MHSSALAQRRGDLPQRIHLMGRLTLDEMPAAEDLSIGPVKILFDEADLPPLDEMVETIRDAHRALRAVAIHTVTRGEIFFALAAIEAAGPRDGDRLEHASLAPDEVVERVEAQPITIVTQPNFVRERGDAYRRHVPAHEHADLYRVCDVAEARRPTRRRDGRSLRIAGPLAGDARRHRAGERPRENGSARTNG